ncbi:hypothetical protein SAMN04515674_101194 [Pseudarcicella hirudinis]|uniref:GAF domain-containing protein n=1 Tax=Pseudarcicella hirudinis TaxID=1079859 RepID=A0A1I5M9C3_9BACT|nr:GAF domain-containing protein [Pseudarcicella hirudinis]SFP06110.1 hypothetical protein SAMN04515674_101194 [Pseudarcicella hirudinis]
MDLLSFSDTPFRLQLCFCHIIENLEKVAANAAHGDSLRAQSLLEEVALYPELRNGITDISQVTGNKELIKRLLADYFPATLTLNEIKAINIPYTNIFFNHTERFRNILNAAGPDFDINIRDFDEHQYYVISCCLILNEYYGTRLDFNKPLFYDIPTAEGIIKHYRILYNADFLEILPTEKSVPLTPEDIEHLLNNYDDVALWKEKFPEESWIVKGFAIMTLFDATVENAVSILKEKLLAISTNGFREAIESIFRSIYRIPDLNIGFTVFNEDENKFSPDTFGQQLPSYILPENHHEDARKLLCLDSYRSIIERKVFFAVSDVSEFLKKNPLSPLAKHLLDQQIKSFILAPVVKDDHLFGVMEVVAFRTKELNSINANKLEVVMPFLADTIERLSFGLQNQVQAVIQDKYTTIHESVYWKFRDEAKRLVYEQQLGREYTLKEIVFPDVYPLYGQIDIRGSSEARNLSVQKDLQKQLEMLLSLLEKVNDFYVAGDNAFLQERQQINDFSGSLSVGLREGTELYISNYLENKIHTRLKELNNPDLLPDITSYFSEMERDTGIFHDYRRKYETSITMINDKLSRILDTGQKEAQSVFPHYYERFKTDGVEHNLYIGHSISPALEFGIKKLYELRLWQLRVLCEMERAHYRLKPTLAYPLDVATLIMVYHSSIDIRFKMDEKRFDVDGSYNIRFEVVKKRIDKANIKNTNERITQTGKIVIVYSNEADKLEYIQYIKTLQAENLLESDIEKLEVEDLQGVSGLKALRVTIVH